MTKKINGLVGLALLGLGAGVGSGAHAAPADQEVTINGGRAPLHGALLAGGTKPGPAVLILPGSGPTDRDSNSTIAGIRPNSLKMLAQGLSDAGFTSLRIDKRGVGQSAAAVPPEIELRFDDMVDDAVAWGRFLAVQKGVTCVVIAGHSEGSLIGALAAQKLEAAKVPVCGFISIAGAGRRAADILREQFKTVVPDALQPQALAALAELEAGREVTGTPPELAGLYRASVQPYMIAWLPKDPVAAVASLKAPVLVIQGDTDLQVKVEDAQFLAAAKPGVELKILPGMNHILKPAPADQAANIATYTDPDLALSPSLTEAIVAFLRKI
jgi:pimeloyl-ACP methyl ester carboxylesterase